MAKRLCVTNVTLLLRVLSWSLLNINVFWSLQKDPFNGKWNLAKNNYFKQNYCHAWDTKFAIFVPLPSCCVSSLITIILTYVTSWSSCNKANWGSTKLKLTDCICKGTFPKAMAVAANPISPPFLEWLLWETANSSARTAVNRVICRTSLLATNSLTILIVKRRFKEARITSTRICQRTQRKNYSKSKVKWL